MTSEPGEDREHVARLMVAMDKHTAFLEGAIGMEMTLIFREFDDVNSVAFIVLPNPSLDMEKNRCENSTTVVADKPDYHVLNSRQKWQEKRGQFRP